MPRFLFILSLAAFTAFFAFGCGASRGMSTDEAKNAYEDAYTTLHAGVTTFDDMRAKYGAPHDRAKTANGFACRWLDRRTISRTSGVMPGGIASFDEGSATGRFRHSMTYVSVMEAFFTEDGTLTSFRLKSDMP